MSIASALNIAVSGLNAAQARAQTVAGNIANANTEGYVRRSVILGEKSVGTQGAGVHVDEIRRETSRFLTLERMSLESDSAYATEKAAAAKQLAEAFGEPGAEQGLAGAYARFENALRDAAATPESSILQQQIIQSSNDIISEFDRLSERATAYRQSANDRIRYAVQDVNSALDRLQEINSLGQERLTPIVLDERQQLVDRINEYIPVEVIEETSTIRLTTQSGFTLVSGDAKQLEFDYQGFINRQTTIENGLSGLRVGETDLTPTNGGRHAIGGGKLAALFETRDVTVPDFENKLDALAFDLVARFAVDDVDPTKVSGEAGLFTTGSSTPPSEVTAGLATQLRINQSVDPSQGGDVSRLRDGLGATEKGAAGNGDHLNRLLDAFITPREVPITVSNEQQSAVALVSGISGISSELNYQYQRFQEIAVYSGARLQAAETAELTQTGVDTDQELQELLQVEQAYAANSKVIETISKLIDQLIELA